MTDKTNIGIKATAKQQTVFLDSEQLLQYMEPADGEETFRFSELSKGYLDVYLVLPATHTVNYKRWLRMMVNQSMRSVLRNGVRDFAHPVAYFLDEAGTSLGHLDAIESAYGLTSGMGVLCWSFYQDINQMKRDYPHSWQTFVANSATIQLLRVGDLETAKYFSEHIGHTTLTTVSKSFNAGSSSSVGSPSHGSTSSGNSTTYGETGRAVLMPEEIMRLADDEMIVMFAGMAPWRQFKIRYFSDGRFNGFYRMDPRRQNKFPPVFGDPEHVAPGKQGWWITPPSENGTGFATFTKPPKKLPMWVKLGALGVVLFLFLGLPVLNRVMNHLFPPHSVEVSAVMRRAGTLPPLPPDMAKAVADAETKRGIELDGVPYNFKFKPLKVTSNSDGTTTVFGIEQIWGRHYGKPGQPKNKISPTTDFQNATFVLRKDNGIWTANETKTQVFALSPGELYWHDRDMF